MFFTAAISHPAYAAPAADSAVSTGTDAPLMELEDAESAEVPADAPMMELEAAGGVENAVVSERDSMPETDLVSESDTGDYAGADEGLAEDELPPIEIMPEIVTRAEAEYPPEIYRQGIEGIVVMDVIVSDSGRVDSVAVLQGVHPVLDSNAVKALYKFTFTPAYAGGEPVPVLIQYQYAFTLQEVVEKIETYVNFSGQVVERGTRSPVQNAMVVVTFADTTADTSLDVPFSVYLQRLGEFEGQYLEEDRLITLTDTVGRFSFYSLPAGPVNISIPITGYNTFSETETIFPAEETMVTYRMDRTSYSEYEIVVYVKKEKKEVSRRQLTLQEVKKIPGIGGDAVKVVQALPGVARPTFGSGEVVVRGAGTADSKFFLDGVEIPLLFHFGGLKSTYNSDALESVDFYPGGWGTRYGGAVAGVIEITGREAKKDRLHGYADANFIDGTFMFEGPVNDKVSIIGSARRSFIGELIGFAAEQMPNTFILTTSPFYWDYLLRTDIDITDKQHAFVTAFGVKDGVKIVSSEVRGGSDDVEGAKDSFNFELIFHMGIAGYDAEFSELLKNSFRYSFTYAKSRTNAFGIGRVQQDVYLNYLRDQLTFTPSEKLTINGGLDFEVYPMDMLLEFPNGQNRISSTNMEGWVFGVLGLYLNFEWAPIEKLLIMPGVRYDFFPELDYSGAWIPEFWNYDFDNTTRFSGEPSFRLTSRYAVTDNHTVKASVGNYSQSPEPQGQSIHPEWGNPALSASRASQYVAGHEWQITDLLHTDIQGYYNHQWDVPRGADSVELRQGLPPFIGDGKRRMYGLEIMLRHDQGARFFGWLAYSLSKSQTWSRREKRWVQFGKDQTHNLIAVGSWKLPREWEVGFRFQYTTGDPYTPAIGQVYNEPYERFEADNGPRNSERLDPTAQLDLRIDKKFIFDKWILSAYVDFFNIGYYLYKSPQTRILNNDMPFDYRTGKPNEQFVYQYSLPSFGIKGEF